MIERFRYLLLVILLLVVGHQALALTMQGRHFLVLAQDALAGGNVSKARNLLTRALANDPGDPELVAFEEQINTFQREEGKKLLQAAEFAFNNKDPKAHDMFQKVLQVDPTNEIALGRLHEIDAIRLEIKKFQELGVRVEVSTGRAFDPKAYSAIALLAAAKKALQSGDINQARDLVQQVLDREPGHGEATRLQNEIQEHERFHKELAEVEQAGRNQNFIFVRERLAKLLERFPLRPHLWVLSARAALVRNEADQAHASLDRALELGADETEVFPLLADVYARKGRYQHAFALAQHAPNGTPLFPWSIRWQYYLRAFPVTVIFLGVAGALLLLAMLWVLKQLDNLIARFSLRVLWRIASALITSYLSGPLAAKDDFALAAKATRLPWFLYVTGLIYLRLDQPEAANKELRECLDTPALAPAAYFFLALAQRAGSPQLAANSLEQALIRGLETPASTWRPQFLRTLEGELIEPWTRTDGKPLLAAVIPVLYALLAIPPKGEPV